MQRRIRPAHNRDAMAATDETLTDRGQRHLAAAPARIGVEKQNVQTLLSEHASERHLEPGQEPRR